MGKWPWLIAGGAATAIVAVVLVTGRAAAGHPDPRPGITAERVLPDAAIPRNPGALEAYAAARSAPHMLDGVYCHCDCSKHAGHRSLLTCFESDHGAFCDICMGEAETPFFDARPSTGVRSSLALRGWRRAPLVALWRSGGTFGQLESCSASDHAFCPRPIHSQACDSRSTSRVA